MGVSLKGDTPKTPQNGPFLVGKPMVVGYHHFRKPTYEYDGNMMEIHVDSSAETAVLTTNHRGAKKISMPHQSASVAMCLANFSQNW